jgi:phage FluMu gp28-like protein
LDIRNTKRFQLGVDLAKYQDWTVLTPFDLTTFQLGKPIRFNQVDWNFQEAKIEAIYYKFFKPKTYIDSTGIGDPVHDHLQEKGIRNLYPYKFTEQSRKDLLIHLQILIESGKIKLPDDEILLNELRSFAYNLIVNPNGQTRVSITIPEGLHDDCVMSAALAVWDIPSEPINESGAEARKLVKDFDYYKRGENKVFTGSPYLRR